MFVSIMHNYEHDFTANGQCMCVNDV